MASGAEVTRGRCGRVKTVFSLSLSVVIPSAPVQMKRSCLVNQKKCVCLFLDIVPNSTFYCYFGVLQANFGNSYHKKIYF